MGGVAELARGEEECGVEVDADSAAALGDFGGFVVGVGVWVG